ncbi:hypothetical protein EZS27_004685 [termite gut metagenome]|uniref:Uncharacterized protein n=1 Tax=termite gut metagenome TaxID=433724 RepID=A0A5J4SRA4_9ZZZZ
MNPVEIEFLMRDSLTPGLQKVGKTVSQTSEQIKAKINEQKAVVKTVESDLKDLEKQYARLSPGRAQAEMRAEILAAKKVLEEEKVALQAVEQGFGQTAVSGKRLSARLKEVQNEMIRMRLSGEQGTSAYAELKKEAATLADTIGDVRTETRALADDNSQLAGGMSGISGVAGAFTAATGVMGVFAGENEDLAKIQTKLQGVMAITMGLQQVMNTLNKDSAFRLVTLTKIKNVFTAANVRLATALGISNMAAKVLMGTLTLGLSVAIGGLIYLWDKYSSAQEKAKKQQEEFASKTSETAASVVADFRRMSQEWEALGKDAKARQKYVDENKEAFEKLGVSITNAAEAENLLVDNKDAFVESMLLKAKGAAAMELASEKYKETIKKMLEAEKMPDKTTVYVSPGGYGMGGASSYQVASKKKAKALEEVRELEKEANELIAKSIGFSALEKSLLAGAGIRTATKTKTKTAGGETDKVSVLSGKQSREAIRAVEDLQYQVDAARIAAMRDGGEKTVAAMKLRHEREMLELGRQREDLLQKKREDARALFAADVNNKGKTFDASEIKLSPEEEAAFGEIMKASLQKQGNELETYYRENLKKYQDYNRAYLALQKKFEEERGALIASGATEEELKNWEREWDDASKALARQYAEKEETFQAWMEGVSEMGITQLRETLQIAEQQLAVAKAKAQQTGKNTNDIAILIAQIEELEAKIKELEKDENKDHGEKKWIKTYRAIRQVNGQLKEIGENIGGATGELLSFATNLSSSMLEMIIGIEELSEESITKVTDTADIATKVLARVERASVILTVIGAALQVFDTISKGIKNPFSNEEDKKYVEDLTKTQDAYNQSLSRTALLHDSVWGDNKIENTLSDVMALGDAIDNYNKKLYEQQKKLVDPKGMSRALKAIYTLGQSELFLKDLANGESNNGTVAARDNLRYITQHPGTFKHTKTTDLEGWVKNNLKTDLFGKDDRLNLDAANAVLSTQANNLTKETRESLESLVEYEEQIRAAEDALTAYIADTFGALGDGASDAIVEAFKNGTDAMEEWGEGFEDILENLGKQLMQTLFFQKAFDGLEKDLNDIYTNNTDANQIGTKVQSLLGNFFEGMSGTMTQAEAWYENWAAQAAQNGFDLKGEDKEDAGSSQSGRAGTFQTMSQDTGTKLEGLFTSVQIHVSNIDDKLSGLDAGIYAISGTLNTIAENTAYCKYLKELVETINAMVRDGLKMK